MNIEGRENNNYTIMKPELLESNSKITNNVKSFN